MNWNVLGLIDPQDSRRVILLMAAFNVGCVLLEAVGGARLQRQHNLVWTRYAVHLTTLVPLFAWWKPERLWQTGRAANLVYMTLGVFLALKPFMPMEGPAQ